MMEDFTGKVVIVTGSSSGIGEQTAVDFARAGAKVTITGRNEANLRQVAQRCREVGGSDDKIHVVVGDLTLEEDVNRIVDSTVEKFGALHVLPSLGAFEVFDYSIMKAALNHFTKCLAMELAPKGVRVNGISPSITETPLFASPGAPFAENPELKTDEFYAGLRSMLPLAESLGRVGQVGDMSAAIRFLASDSAAFITGVMLPVDGGQIVTSSTPKFT